MCVDTYPFTYVFRMSVYIYICRVVDINTCIYRCVDIDKDIDMIYTYQSCDKVTADVKTKLSSYTEL